MSITHLRDCCLQSSLVGRRQDLVFWKLKLNFSTANLSSHPPNVLSILGSGSRQKHASESLSPSGSPLRWMLFETALSDLP